MSGTSRETGVLIEGGMQRGLQTFSIYDAESRLESFYEAPTNAKHGAPAFLTQYKYNLLTSVIIATKETVSVWDSSYDFDALP